MVQNGQKWHPANRQLIGLSPYNIKNAIISTLIYI